MTLAYIWLFYPHSFALAVNLKKLEWRANIDDFFVDLHLHEGTYRSEGINSPIKSVSIGIRHEYTSFIGGAFPRTDMLFAKHSRIGERKAYVRESQYMIFDAKNRDSESNCVSSQIWIRLQQRGQLLNNCFRSPQLCLLMTENRLDDGRNIYFLGTDQSIQGEVPFSSVPDFARIGLDSVGAIDNATIGSYSNLVVSSLYGKGRAMTNRSLRESANRRYKKGDQPRWVRLRYSQYGAQYGQILLEILSVIQSPPTKTKRRELRRVT